MPELGYFRSSFSFTRPRAPVRAPPAPACPSLPSTAIDCMTLRHFTLRLGASLLRICGALALVALLALVYMAAITQMPSRSHRGPLPVASADQAALAQRLRQHVVAVASVEHNLRQPAALDAAARYLEAELDS